MKRVLHSLMLVIGLIGWFIGVLGFVMATGAAVLGERLIPGFRFGNCWSFALPRYVQSGGYLIVRPADDVLFLGRFQIPHVIWAQELPLGMPVQQFVPLARSHSKFLPWKTIWYAGRQRNRERARRSTPQPDTNLADL